MSLKRHQTLPYEYVLTTFIADLVNHGYAQI